jgi:hypothetical protein
MTKKLAGVIGICAISCSLAALTSIEVNAATFKVDCSKNGGPSIQDRINNNANPGDTIEISGACTESVTVTKDSLRLVGVGGTVAPNGSGINGSSGIVGGTSITAQAGENSVIVVLGRNVRIERLSISGGLSSTIVISRGGSARVIDSVVSDGGNDGIIATRGTYIEVRQTEIKNNGRHGIFLRNSSSADIHLNDINNNGDSSNDGGVTVTGSSSADLDGNDIHDNAGDGVILRRAASINFSSDPSVDPNDRSNRISSNGDDGIVCFSNAAYRVAVNQTIDGNGGDGTDRFDGCSARVANNVITCPPSLPGPSLTIPDPTLSCVAP